MALTKVSYSLINGPVANVVDFGADPTGVADSYAAIQAAYVSNAAIIQFPAGTFKMTQTLYVDRGVIINGAGAQDGSGNSGQSAGVATTKIDYTGTGNAIDIIGSYTEGVSNVHLSNFMLDGTALADGGLFIGSGVVVTKCTFKNLGIFGFNNPTENKGYGLGIQNCLESVFENVYIHSCTDGVNMGFGALTSLEFRSVFSRVNARYGWLIRQGNGCSFYQCMAEANLKTGLVINTRDGQNISDMSFYSWYSEFNAVDADTYPGALIRTTGSGACQKIFFYSPSFSDYNTYNYSTNVWDIALIKLGLVDEVRFLNAECISVNSNFIECQSNTTECEWQGTGGSSSSSNVTGNTFVGPAFKVKTTAVQTPDYGVFQVNMTDTFTTVWAIPVSVTGLLCVIGGADGRYGGAASFIVCRSAIGNAGVAATSTFVGDASGYTITWQLSGNNFQIRHDQVGQTIDARLCFMPLNT